MGSAEGHRRSSHRPRKWPVCPRPGPRTGGCEQDAADWNGLDANVEAGMASGSRRPCRRSSAEAEEQPLTALLTLNMQNARDCHPSEAKDLNQNTVGAFKSQDRLRSKTN